MRPTFRRPGDHDRARELAATRLDEALTTDDAAWLDAHLAGCPTCREVAAAFEADSLLFSPLRETPPVPPRDLWARTAAAIDAEAGGSRGGSRSPVRGVGPGVLVPIAGLAAIAVVASTVLLNGATVVPTPSGPGATAMAMDPGQVAIITRNPDGGLTLVTAGVDEVCPITADRCDAEAPSFSSASLAGIPDSDNVDAILSPGRDRVVVVQRDAAGAEGVFVVPVQAAGAETGTPSPETTEEPGETATDGPTGTPDDPGLTPSPSDDPPESASPSADPSTDPTATDEPTETPSDEPTHEATPDPTPTVEVTPAADGAIEIASDVVVVGSVAAYNRDGSRFAFTARPADGSNGPDVYVWDPSEARARAVTDDHASVFAGWQGNDLLVSRADEGAPWTMVIDPRTGEVREELGAAWLPTVSPDGSTAAWWDGSIRLGGDGVTWVPDKGRLVVGPWPGGLTDAGPLQVIDRGAIGDWEVQWDPAGRALAAWTTGPDGGRIGRLGLYELESGTGRAGLTTPLFEDPSAFRRFSLDQRQLVYATPDDKGGRDLWAVKWNGESVGRVLLPDDAMVIR